MEEEGGYGLAKPLLLDVLELLAAGSHHLVGWRGEGIVSSGWDVSRCCRFGRGGGNFTSQRASAGVADVASQGLRRNCLDALAGHWERLLESRRVWPS